MGGRPSSRTAIALAAGALALVALVWTVDARRRPAPSAPTAERAAAVEPETALALAAPSIAEPTVVATIDPSDAPSTRTAAEPAPLALTFRVLEKGSDAPIAGAHLRTYEDSAPGTWTTDESGVCLVTLPRSARDFRLHVEADGYAHLALREWDDEGTELRLTRATTLMGRLLAADTGEALPGARITLARDDCEVARVVAGGDGRYELGGVPLRDAETLIVLESEGFPRQVRQFELRSDERRIEQDFLLQRGIEIHGRVHDWVSGAGVAGASVQGVTTGASGAFRGRILADPTAPITTLRVEAPGYCELTVELDPGQLGDEHELRLPRAAFVEGTIRDRAGRPIAGASLGLQADHSAARRLRREGIVQEPTPLDERPKRWHLYPEGHVSSAVSAADGRYRISVLPWSRVLTLWANAEAHDGVQHPLDSVGGPGEGSRVDLVLDVDETPEATLRGTVRLNGDMLRTARGRVRWKGSSREGEESILRGAFTARVEPGEVALDVEIEGLPAELEGAHVALATVPEDVTVDLRMPTRSISGRVTYTDGTPAGGVPVKASCELHAESTEEYGYWEELPVSTSSGPDGRYLLDVPDLDRPYDVEAAVRNERASVMAVQAGAQNVDLVLHVPGRLVFRALDAVTRAAIGEGDLDLGWKPREEQRFRHWPVGGLAADSDGWREDELFAGRVDLCARTSVSNHVPMVIEDVLVPATGEPPRIEFALERGLRVQLVLADGVEPPPPCAIVLVEEAFFDHVRFEPLGNSVDGGALGGAVLKRFVRFDGGRRTCEPGALGPGRYRFKVDPPNIVVAPEFVTLLEGENPPIELRWRPAR